MLRNSPIGTHIIQTHDANCCSVLEVVGFIWIFVEVSLSKRIYTFLSICRCVCLSMSMPAQL